MKTLPLALAAAALITTVPQVCAQNWTLVWSDEFDGNGLPDASKWSYDEGGGGWGNGELQYYTTSRAENASVANGVLSITARKETYQSNAYTSARLVTRGKGDWLYGKVEVKAKLPRGRGMWPAIWMLPTDWEYGDWPASGEFDIMENVGYDSTCINSNIHTKAYNHTIGTNKGDKVYLADPWDTWHVYKIEWYADSVSYWVDDTHIFSFANENTGYTTWPFDKRFHLILNIAVGGSWGGANGVDDSRFPQTMQVDYVRVYQTEGGSVVDPIAPPEGELVWNGDFSQGGIKWQPVGSYEGASASGSLDGETYHVSVTTPGTQNWHVQFSQVNIPFEKGKTYQVSFNARASVARDIAVAANQNVSPWTTYGKDTVSLSTTMESYSFSFTMQEPTDLKGRIEFDLGGVVSEIWIDDVSVREISSTGIKPILKPQQLRQLLRQYDLLGRQ